MDRPSLAIRTLKAGLSIFLVYHLLVVLILPMGSGLVIRQLGHYLIPYANILSFNTTWQFFSPGPSPTLYVEYVYTYPAAAGLNAGETTDSEPQIVPEKRLSFGYSDFYNRRLYSLRFLALDETKLKRYLVPWLCKKDPRAESVSVRQTFGEVEGFERQAGSGAESFADMTKTNTTRGQRYSCRLSPDGSQDGSHDGRGDPDDIEGHDGSVSSERSS